LIVQSPFSMATSTYLEMTTKFWRISSAANGLRVTTTYGKIGAAGQTTIKDFPDSAKASAFLKKQAGAKAKKGYTDAVDPTAPVKAKAKRKAAGGAKPAAVKKAKVTKAATAAAAAAAPVKAKAKAKAKPKKKPVATKKKSGLGGQSSAPDLDEYDDEEDEPDAGLEALNKVMFKGAAVTSFARLALVDHVKNIDKYYIIQLLEHKKKFFVYRRSGRTGSSGQAQLDGPFTVDDATAQFEKLFKQKSGQDWEGRDAAAVPTNAKHYTYLKPTKADDDDDDGDVTWEYELTADPQGKPDGWYAYDQAAGDEVEELYKTFSAGNTSMSVRYVHVPSSGYTYRVDMNTNTQTNTSSGKGRNIRRVDEPLDAQD